MAKSIKVYSHDSKTHELKSSRLNWDGNFPTDVDGFERNGYRKMATLGGELGLTMDVHTNDTHWLIDIWAFSEHVTCIRVNDPLLYLKTLDELSQSSVNILKAIELSS